MLSKEFRFPMIQPDTGMNTTFQCLSGAESYAYFFGFGTVKSIGTIDYCQSKKTLRGDIQKCRNSPCTQIYS